MHFSWITQYINKCYIRAKFNVHLRELDIALSMLSKQYAPDSLSMLNMQLIEFSSDVDVEPDLAFSWVRGSVSRGIK